MSDAPINERQKAEIRRLRSIKRRDGSHVWTLQRLADKYGVTYQRIGQIVNPEPGKISNARYRASEKGRATQAKHNRRRTMVGLSIVYMQHYKKHRMKGIKDPNCHFCQRARV